MLVLLFVLSVISLIVSFVMNARLKKLALGTTFSMMALIQGGTLGAMVGLLLVLLIKGRTLG